MKKPNSTSKPITSPTPTPHVGPGEGEITDIYRDGPLDQTYEVKPDDYKVEFDDNGRIVLVPKSK